MFTLIAQCQITASEDPVSPSLCMPSPSGVLAIQVPSDRNVKAEGHRDFLLDYDKL